MIVLGCGIVYAFLLYRTVPNEATQGYFSISSLQPHQTPFYRALVYKGTLYCKQGKIPCSIPFQGASHPRADCDYVVEGKLEQRGPYEYQFKAKQWTPVENTWSAAETRYQLKEQFRKFLEKKLQRPRTAKFLSSLITGDVEDRSLRYEFGRLGLQHILAISGFHFGILIAFLSLLAGFFLSPRGTSILLLIAVNLYFLFLGPLPAVERSWITAVSYLAAKAMKWNTTGLNLLGFALAIEVLFNPLISANIGFQLSFLSCAGILLCYPQLERGLKKAFPQRNREEFSALSFFSQQGALLSTFLRRGISIGFSVNLAIFPVLLIHFHQFPYLSLLYNLFFPFLVGLALSALLLSLIGIVLFAPLGNLLFWVTDFFTSWLLNLAAYPPIALEYSIKTSQFPSWTFPFYLFSLLCLSLKFDEYHSLR